MDLVLLSRLEYVESERHLNGRWDGLCRLLERWSPHIKGRRASEQVDLYDHIADLLVRAAERREHPPLSVVPPPQTVEAEPATTTDTAAASKTGTPT